MIPVAGFFAFVFSLCAITRAVRKRRLARKKPSYLK
jgi:hypothetical protein